MKKDIELGFALLKKIKEVTNISISHLEISLDCVRGIKDAYEEYCGTAGYSEVDFFIKELPYFENLSSLKLDNLPLNIMRFFSRLPIINTIQKLEIVHPIGIDNFSVIPSRFPKLTHLSCNLDCSLQNDMTISTMRSLRFLHLKNNIVVDPSGREVFSVIFSVIKLFSMPNLTQVKLEDFYLRISEKAIKALTTSKLEKIDFGACKYFGNRTNMQFLKTMKEYANVVEFHPPKREKITRELFYERFANISSSSEASDTDSG